MATPRFYTPAEAAAELGCSRPTVSRRAQELGLGVRIGATLALSDADIDRLRKVIQAGPGNPNFTPGNRYGKPAPKPKSTGKKSQKKSS